MSAAKKLKNFLDENNIKYTCITHSKAYTAQEIASKSHIPGKEIAKTVVLKVDGKYVLAVLPATKMVSFKDFKNFIGAKDVRLATEQEFMDLFPDCEVGAMPPFGNLYDMPTYVSSELKEDEEIAFNACNHMDLIKMKYPDWENLVKPIVVQFGL
jgi:Ala-tRNA(Pro) deacylase